MRISQIASSPARQFASSAMAETVEVSVNLNVGVNGKVGVITSIKRAPSPPSKIFLYASEVLVTTMSTNNNNCLLRALSFDASPKGRKAKGGRQEQAMRQEIARAVREFKSVKIKGKTLERRVAESSGMDADTWATKYETTSMMSDQVVLLVWPLLMKEAIWVWIRTDTGDMFCNAYCFTAPSGSLSSIRHVVYHADRKHYDALTIQPQALRRGMARALEQGARAATVPAPLQHKLGATPRHKKLPAKAPANTKTLVAPGENPFAALVIEDEEIYEQDEKDKYSSLLKEEKGQVWRLAASPLAQGPRRRKPNQLPS